MAENENSQQGASQSGNASANGWAPAGGSGAPVPPAAFQQASANPNAAEQGFAPQAGAQQNRAPQAGAQPAAEQGCAQQAGNQPGANQPGANAAWQQPQAQYAPGAAYAPASGYAPNACAPAQSALAPKKKSHGWIVAIVVVVALLIVSLVGISSCTRMVTSLGVSGAEAAGAVDAAANSVGVIEIDDTIAYDNSANSPEGLKYLLDEAADSDNIVAVVLRVNSGGGSATAGEEMATYVKQFREETGKPVVVSSAALNASAAYEISSQADYIFVANTTEIGAIGTVMQSADYSELLGKLGIRIDNIASAESKDSSYGTRPLTDDERAYYQGIVDQINDLFIQNVAEGRNMSTDDVRKLATGMVFTGKTAVENGLADAIGTREDAIEYAARTAGCLRGYTTYNLEISESYDLSSLAGLLGKSSTSDDLKSLLKEQSENGNTVR